jgi:signal transduction histidine kinase
MRMLKLIVAGFAVAAIAGAAVLFIFPVASTPMPLEASEPPSELGRWDRFVDRTADAVFPKIGAIDRRLGELDGLISTLPEVNASNSAGGSGGYHMDLLAGAENGTLRLSWDTPQTIDTVSVVPARLPVQRKVFVNYGFPQAWAFYVTHDGERRCVARVADTELDRRRGDPILVAFPPVLASELDIEGIGLQSNPVSSGHAFALAEVFVFSGADNVAQLAEVDAPWSIEGNPEWGRRFVIDEQTPIGLAELPVFHSEIGFKSFATRSPDKPKWIQIDLSEPTTIDAVRLYPAEIALAIARPGSGFPVRFSLEVKADGDGGSAWRTVHDQTGYDFPNPGTNPVTLRIGSQEVAAVRLLVTKQEKVEHPDAVAHILLSEIELLHRGEAVAAEAAVSSSDETGRYPGTQLRRSPEDPPIIERFWSEAALTDGFTSRGRILPARDWLESLVLRFELRKERENITRRRGDLTRRTGRVVLGSVVGLTFMIVVALVAWAIRARFAHRRGIRTVRTQIASDLHDDVGSNLGAIALVADRLGRGASSRGGEERESESDTIRRLALESTAALKQIVWLTAPEIGSEVPLDHRVRETADAILHQIPYTFEIRSPVSELQLPPPQRRALLLFLKEALHNIASHASATQVGITLERESNSGQWRLCIADDGAGIPAEKLSHDATMRTIKHRARQLGAEFAVDSTPGDGTRLTLGFRV